MKTIITLAAILMITGCNGISNNKETNTLPDSLQVMLEDAQLINTRSAGKGITLEAYRIPTGEDSVQFKVYLVTHKGKGQFVDALDLHEFHTREHKGPMTFGGNRFYTTDAELRFNGDRHIILHRVMTLTSIYLKDHSLTEAWRVEWDNHYEIDDSGHFVFKGQQETLRNPSDLNDPIIDTYKSRDLPAQ